MGCGSSLHPNDKTGEGEGGKENDTSGRKEVKGKEKKGSPISPPPNENTGAGKEGKETEKTGEKGVDKTKAEDEVAVPLQKATKRTPVPSPEGNEVKGAETNMKGLTDEEAMAGFLKALRERLLPHADTTDKI